MVNVPTPPQAVDAESYECRVNIVQVIHSEWQDTQWTMSTTMVKVPTSPHVVDDDR